MAFNHLRSNEYPQTALFTITQPKEENKPTKCSRLPMTQKDI